MKELSNHSETRTYFVIPKPPNIKYRLLTDINSDTKARVGDRMCVSFAAAMKSIDDAMDDCEVTDGETLVAVEQFHSPEYETKILITEYPEGNEGAIFSCSVRDVTRLYVWEEKKPEC